jgi:predicted nucleotidyltransferase
VVQSEETPASDIDILVEFRQAPIDAYFSPPAR